MMSTRGKINATNLQKLSDICGYELLTNLQNFTQKDLTKMKIYQNCFRGATFFKHPVYVLSIDLLLHCVFLLLHVSVTTRHILVCAIK